MHPEDIKAALRKRGHTQTDIARRLHVAPASVHHVVAGRYASQRIAKAIAQATDLSLDDLWPGRYDYLKPTEQSAA